jgi:hypothetical protein
MNEYVDLYICNEIDISRLSFFLKATPNISFEEIIDEDTTQSINNENFSKKIKINHLENGSGETKCSNGI